MLRALHSRSACGALAQDQTIDILGTLPADGSLLESGEYDWEGIDNGVKLVRTSNKLPVITDRDFVAATMPRAEAAVKGVSDLVVSTVSVDMPHLPMAAVRKQFIRGVVLTCGWHIKKLPSPPGLSKQEQCGVTFVSITRLNGDIPGMVLKSQTKGGGEIAANLKKIAEASK